MSFVRWSTRRVRCFYCFLSSYLLLRTKTNTCFLVHLVTSRNCLERWMSILAIRPSLCPKELPQISRIPMPRAEEALGLARCTSTKSTLTPTHLKMCTTRACNTTSMHQATSHHIRRRLRRLSPMSLIMDRILRRRRSLREAKVLRVPRVLMSTPTRSHLRCLNGHPQASSCMRCITLIRQRYV